MINWGVTGSPTSVNRGQPAHAAFGRVGAEPVQPVGDRRAAAGGEIVRRQLERMFAVLDLDLVAGADKVTRDVELPSVDGDVPVRDHLPCLGAAGGESEPRDHVVEPPFQKRHQSVAGVTRPPAGFFVVFAELALEDPVVALDLLFLSQANGIFTGLAAAKLMHARHAVASIDGALGRVAPCPFQKELGAFAPAEPANWSNMTSHGGRTALGRV